MAFPSSLQETAKFCTWGSKSLQNRKGRRQHSRAVAKESTNSPHLPNETHTREAISLPKQENPWVSLAVTEGEDLDSDKARETLRESMWFTPHMSATCSPLGPHPPPQPLKLKDLFMNACPSEHPTEAPCFWASPDKKQGQHCKQHRQQASLLLLPFRAGGFSLFCGPAVTTHRHSRGARKGPCSHLLAWKRPEKEGLRRR